MEVGWTRCFVLGYYFAWICSWFICRSGIPYGFNQSVWWNTSLSLRQLPFAGYQSLFICIKSVYKRCLLRFWSVQKTCSIGTTYHGWYYRSGIRKDREDPWKDRFWPGINGSEGNGTSFVGKDTEEDSTRPSYRCGYHCWRRYDCGFGTSLRNGWGYRVCRRNSEDIGLGGLSFFRHDG